MNADGEPGRTRPRGLGDRIARAVLTVALVLAGLAVGAVAGLFIAGWAGWLPQIC